MKNAAAAVERRTGFFEQYFERVGAHLNNVNRKDLDRSVELISGVTRDGAKVIVAGNGGSAAMASHVSVDLTKTAQVRSISFNEADLITCLANDYGYERWVEKGIEFYADKKDVAVLISSSGQSKNIINGAVKAKEMGLKVITLSGFNADNPLRRIGHVNFWIDSREYNVVEMVHHVWLLAVVDKIIKDKGL